MTAASALFLLCGIGMIKHVHAGNHVIGDIIPVDFCADYAIVAAALMASCKSINVFHCGSSNRNPVVWGLTRDMV